MSIENEQTRLRETVWRQLVGYIDEQEYFFPFKIRQQISEDAYPILDDFINLLIERGMLVEFKRKSFFNRIAHWIYKRRMKRQNQNPELLEVYTKGDNWETAKTRTYAELAGVIESPGEEIVTH